MYKKLLLTHILFITSTSFAENRKRLAEYSEQARFERDFYAPKRVLSYEQETLYKLINCFKESNYELANEIITQISDINAKVNSVGSTLLIDAVNFFTQEETGHLAELILFLLDHGADASAETIFGETVLHKLASIPTMSRELFYLILEKIPEYIVNQKNSSGETYSHYAARRPETLHLVNPQHLNTQDDNGCPVLYKIIETGELEAIADFILEDTGQGIFNAIENENFTQVIVNKKKGARINLSCPQTKKTPLTLASSKNNIYMVSLLHHLGAGVNHADKNLETPLHAAASSENPDITRLLLNLGANLAAEDSIDATPLHIAAQKGNHAAVKLLLEAGANPNALNVFNEPPLFEAITSRSIAVIHTLLAYGANPYFVDYNNRSNLSLAQAWGDPDVISLFQN